MTTPIEPKGIPLVDRQTSEAFLREAFLGQKVSIGRIGNVCEVVLIDTLGVVVRLVNDLEGEAPMWLRLPFESGLNGASGVSTRRTE